MITKYIDTIFYINRSYPRVVFTDKVILIDECWMKVNIWKKKNIKLVNSRVLQEIVLVINKAKNW